VAQSLQERQELNAVLNEVRSNLLRELEEELPRLRANKSQSGLMGSLDLTVLFATVENGVPIAAAIHFPISDTGPLLNPESHVCPGLEEPGFCMKRVAIWVAGRREAIERQSKKLEEIHNRNLARELVQLEIDAGAPGVGGPVDVVRISRADSVYEGEKVGSDCPKVISP
jgi:hypothetical protein